MERVHLGQRTGAYRADTARQLSVQHSCKAETLPLISLIVFLALYLLNNHLKASLNAYLKRKEKTIIPSSRSYLSFNFVFFSLVFIIHLSCCALEVIIILD